MTFPVVSTNVITGFSVRGISINTSANIIYWTEYPTMKIRMGSLATIPVSPRTDVVTGLLELPRSLQFYPCVAPGIVSITADNNALCSGSTANLTANGITGNNALVTWYSGPLGTGANLGTGTTLSNVGVGTYYARVTGTCGTPAEKFITITGEITPPSITCPVNVVEPNMGGCNKSFHIDNPIYSDNCGSIQSLTWKLTGATTSSSLATGIKLLGTRTFNNGVTYVTYTAKDSANNTSTCSFTITLNDVVIPVFTTTNTSILDSFPSACLKSIFIPDVTFTDNCGTPLLTWNKAGATNESGSGQMGQTNFNVGVTNVTDTITDANGNKKTTAFTVTLLDNLPPNLTCPPDKTPSVLPSGCSKIVTTTPPSFSDNCTIQSLTWSMSGSTILSSPLTGINLVGSKTFNAGTTVVTYTAKDPSGNSTVCSFNVKLNTVDVCPTAIIARGISTSEVNVIKLKARLTPNPTTSSFALQIQSDSKEEVEVSVYNNEGKKVQYLKVTPQQVICIGEKYVNGMYLFEVRQGDKRTTVTGVKQ